MIDPAFLRENPELVKRSQEARGESPESVDEALSADRGRRAAITAFEELRAAQNAHGKRVAQAPKDEKASSTDSGDSPRASCERLTSSGFSRRKAGSITLQA